jgi:hypothetical protein
MATREALDAGRRLWSAQNQVRRWLPLLGTPGYADSHRDVLRLVSAAIKVGEVRERGRSRRQKKGERHG